MVKTAKANGAEVEIGTTGAGEVKSTRDGNKPPTRNNQPRVKPIMLKPDKTLKTRRLSTSTLLPVRVFNIDHL